MRSSVNDSDPIATWPRLKSLLHARADERAVGLSRGSTLELDAGRAVLAADLGVVAVSPVSGPSVEVPANGVLTFAVDVDQPMYATGSVSIAADPRDLRPGLRAYVLSDATVVGAPMIHQALPAGDTQINFDLPGTTPAAKAPLRSWRLEPGRHYISIAGPHYRAAGVFERLELRGLSIEPQTPTYTFAHVPDVHMGEQKRAVAAELIETFRLLRSQGIAFTIVGGDMASRATRDEFAIFATVVETADGFPIYGCVGNHDAYHASSRTDMLELLPSVFPGRQTNYVLNQPPLRFIVVDAAYWKMPAGKTGDLAPGWSVAFPGSDSPGCGMGPRGLEWLRRTLAADTTTPTVIVSHFPFLFAPAEHSQCGYRLDDCGENDRELEPFIKAAPNVAATLNGHLHWNHLDIYPNDHGDDILSFQGPAFCDWPCGYQVFRVYGGGDDVRLEWEMCLMDNMGFVATGGETPSRSASLSWKISTSYERDLVSEPGGVRLARG